MKSVDDYLLQNIKESLEKGDVVLPLKYYIDSNRSNGLERWVIVVLEALALFSVDNNKWQTRRANRKKSDIENIVENTATRQIGHTAARELSQGLLGALGVRSTKRKRTLW